MTPSTRTDPKGKIFTDQVKKKPLRVLAQTSTETFIGAVYLRPQKRLLDELNDA